MLRGSCRHWQLVGVLPCLGGHQVWGGCSSNRVEPQWVHVIFNLTVPTL